MPKFNDDPSAESVNSNLQNDVGGFVIYGAMRTGSNLLVSILNQFDGVICHGEAFNPAFVGLREDLYASFGLTRADWMKRDAQLNVFYEKILSGVSPGMLCGFKMFAGHNAEILHRTLADRSLRKIILKRDLLTSYISLCQTEQSGVWLIPHGNAGAVANQRQKSDLKIKFDGQRFLEYRKLINSFYREIEVAIARDGQQAMTIWYRELTDQKTVDKLAEFLCRPKSQVPLDREKLLVKQNFSFPHDRVSNLAEMINFLELHGLTGPVVETAKKSLLGANDDNNDATPPPIFQLNGILLDLESPAISPGMRKRIRGGMYEREESKYLPVLIDEGDIVLELGGGIGYISSLVWKTGKCSSITVVEANPETIPVIEESHRLNNVEARVINGVAVASCAPGATMPFYIRSDFWASSLSPEPWRYKAVVDVQCVDIQKLVYDLQPSVLICDIEGGEAELLPNLKMLSVRKILLELHEGVIGHSGVSAILSHLTGEGFVCDSKLSTNGVMVFRRA